MGLVWVGHHSGTGVGVVDFGKFDILVVGNELLGHHGASTDLDDEMVPHVLDAHLLGSVDIVALADSLPRYRASVLVDVVGKALVNNVVLDWHVELVLWLLRSRLSVQKSVKLGLEVGNDLIFDGDLFLQSFHIVVEALDSCLKVSDNDVQLFNLANLLSSEPL